MTFELRDVLTILSILVAAASVIIVSRNARRATAVQAQNTDLARIRDLRAEVAETKAELGETRQEMHRAKGEAMQLAVQVQTMNEALTKAYQRHAEMLMFARMPGVTIEDWVQRFDQAPPEITPNLHRT